MKKILLRTLLLAMAFAFVPNPAQAQTRSGRLDVSKMPRPIEALDSVWIEEPTMMEVRDAIQEGKTTALILTGGIEENGPYLATGKHNYVLRVMGESIARELGDALVAPIVTLEPGDPERVRTPGTVYLSRDTYKAVLRDMATSLETQGFTHIFLLGDSGGNQTPMKEVAEELTARWQGGPARVTFIPEYYNYDDVQEFEREELGIHEVLEGYHDDYYISSIMMNADPRSVHMEQRIKAGKFSINGVSLAPAAKTIENGRKIIRFRTEATVKAIRQAMASK